MLLVIVFMASTGQSSSSPYTVTVNQTTYQPGDTIQVTLSGTITYKGFLLEAHEEGQNTAVGTFSLGSGTGIVLVPCNGIAASGVSQSNNQAKSSVTVTWTSPSSASLGNIVVKSTFMQTSRVFWIAVPSVTVKRLSSVVTTTRAQTTPTLAPTTTTTAPSTTTTAPYTTTTGPSTTTTGPSTTTAPTTTTTIAQLRLLIQQLQLLTQQLQVPLQQLQLPLQQLQLLTEHLLDLSQTALNSTTMAPTATSATPSPTPMTPNTSTTPTTATTPLRLTWLRQRNRYSEPKGCDVRDDPRNCTYVSVTTSPPYIVEISAPAETLQGYLGIISEILTNQIKSNESMIVVYENGTFTVQKALYNGATFINKTQVEVTDKELAYDPNIKIIQFSFIIPDNLAPLLLKTLTLTPRRVIDTGLQKVFFVRGSVGDNGDLGSPSITLLTGLSSQVSSSCGKPLFHGLLMTLVCWNLFNLLP
ncbi:uncharacterized protein [Salvelinus sp. IW2-2015]|uniref:uncharacterized protein isoform X1 n=2 Tax=Salvelinus sp. IW2-2015 TaxID=2691554 RepID=UPI0038D4E729